MSQRARPLPHARHGRRGRRRGAGGLDPAQPHGRVGGRESRRLADDVAGRVSLDMLRARRSRREDYVGSWMPEPIVAIDDGPTPEDEALIADGVGLALYVVLETLAPPERLAFVLHDMFAVPFDEIATIVGRSREAARQLASRARRRVQGARPEPDVELSEQRRVIDAFLAASRTAISTRCSRSSIRR